jgi:hypothetical protein
MNDKKGKFGLFLIGATFDESTKQDSSGSKELVILSDP